MVQESLCLPNTGFLRLADVLKFIPVKKTRWYEGVKSGEFPAPVALSQRIKLYRVEDIRALIQHLGNSGDA